MMHDDVVCFAWLLVLSPRRGLKEAVLVGLFRFLFVHPRLNPFVSRRENSVTETACNRATQSCLSETVFMSALLVET